MTKADDSAKWDLKYSYAVRCSDKVASKDAKGVDTTQCRPKNCEDLGTASTKGNCMRLNQIARLQGIASACVWRDACSAKITMAVEFDTMATLWKKDRSKFTGKKLLIEDLFVIDCRVLIE